MSKQRGLFGEDVEMNKDKITHGHYVDLKRANNFRKGIISRCCKWCKHLVVSQGNTKKYFKCSLMGVSSSEASDIRLYNVCNKFEENPNDQS